MSSESGSVAGGNRRHGLDVFVSYARADNVPDGSGVGWVTGIKNLIEEDSRLVEGREYRMLMDTTEIHGMQDSTQRPPSITRR